jgi:hypothetical protein
MPQTSQMTPLALAADLEAKHKALVEADKRGYDSVDDAIARQGLQQKLVAQLTNNILTIIASLQQSGEAIERAAKVVDDEADAAVSNSENLKSAKAFSAASRIWNYSQHMRSLAAKIRALKPEPPR